MLYCPTPTTTNSQDNTLLTEIQLHTRKTTMMQFPLNEPSQQHNPFAVIPLRDDSATIACLVCHKQFVPAGRQRYCSGACKNRAYRHRTSVPATEYGVPHGSSPKAHSVYECSSCGVLLLGEQRCAECGIFMHRLGWGGCCPNCDEPVVVNEIIPPNAYRQYPHKD